jgi:hypothetical protein
MFFPGHHFMSYATSVVGPFKPATETVSGEAGSSRLHCAILCSTVWNVLYSLINGPPRKTCAKLLYYVLLKCTIWKSLASSYTTTFAVLCSGLVLLFTAPVYVMGSGGPSALNAPVWHRNSYWVQQFSLCFWLINRPPQSNASTDGDELMLYRLKKWGVGEDEWPRSADDWFSHSSHLKREAEGNKEATGDVLKAWCWLFYTIGSDRACRRRGTWLGGNGLNSEWLWRKCHPALSQAAAEAAAEAAPRVGPHDGIGVWV